MKVLPTAATGMPIVVVMQEASDSAMDVLEACNVIAGNVSHFTNFATANSPVARHSAENPDTNRSAPTMNEFSRQELDAKLEATEARMDARIATITGQIETFLAAQKERDKAFEKVSDERFQRMAQDVATIKSDISKASEDVSGIKITMAKYLGAAIVIGAVASAALGALIRQYLSAV